MASLGGIPILPIPELANSQDAGNRRIALTTRKASNGRRLVLDLTNPDHSLPQRHYDQLDWKG